VLARFLHIDEIANEPVRPLVHEKLTLTRGLAQPKRGLHRIAGRVRLSAVAAGDDLARADPGAQLEPGTPLSFEFLSQPDEPIPHLRCGARGTHRIVLVHEGNAEDRGDGSAERALDRGPVTFEYR
jgi:hypothetical protein